MRTFARAALAGTLLLVGVAPPGPGRADVLPACDPTIPRAAEPDLETGFRDPPPGYGEVPFWWWTGDQLDRSRLLWQIEELHRKGIAGMQVNYAHQDTPGWPTYPAEPAIFSDPWWETWRFVVTECRKRGMSVGLSGYTLDWPGRGDNLFGRLIYGDPELNGRELTAARRDDVEGGSRIDIDVAADAVSIRAYPLRDGRTTRGGVDLSGEVVSGRLSWTAPAGRWRVYVFAAPRKPLTLDPMHPLSGRRVVERFFQAFEDRSGGSSAGLDYFFQDELRFGVSGRLWTADFAERFRERKGYDLREVLPALFEDIGPKTPKVRMDYADVKAALTEERYFRPIFEWHALRGLTYGCDPGSRGKDPSEFGDYFRCVRWYTAPGHDTPGGQADLIKDKVSSSIAHLYGRPRVWLEGYHSLGWGASPAAILRATRENFLYGCTLLNLHGLYYTTHGSFWEWAPPCYHFRQPYWDHLPVFLKYFERLSWLLTRGAHRCDIAILYPVAPFDAGMDGEGAAAAAFETGTRLMDAGRDFDFVDFESLARAEVRGGRVEVAGESYRALVLPAMRAIRWSSLEKAAALARAGGLVVAAGALPEASDRAGREDPKLDAVVAGLFGAKKAEWKIINSPPTPPLSKGGENLLGDRTGIAAAGPEEAAAEISKRIPPGVRSDAPVRSLHRRAGDRDIFMVMGLPNGAEATFPAAGKAEMWDPWTGDVRALEVVSRRGDETTARMPADSEDARVIVFSPGAAGAESAEPETEIPTAAPAPSSLLVQGPWEFELTPTMDNRWGDFRLPATDAVIGAEARRFRHAREGSAAPGWERPGFDDSAWATVTGGFGTKFWKLGPLPDGADASVMDAKLSALRRVDPASPVEAVGRAFAWTPYGFSWRWGVEGDPGHQGYHGLKENVGDDFIRLGAKTDGLNETLYVPQPEGRRYYLWTVVPSPERGRARVIAGDEPPDAAFLNGRPLGRPASLVELDAGDNVLLLRYDRPVRGHFVLEREDAGDRAAARTPLSMAWFDRSGVLGFEPWADGEREADCFRFVAPPGLTTMTIEAHGTIGVWAGGRDCAIERVGSGLGGASVYRARLDRAVPTSCAVAIRVQAQPGFSGGAALSDPVRLDCGPGTIPLGDWSTMGALEFYSGGAWYRKTIMVDETRARGRAVLDLGDVAATAEVRVNGRSAGIRVAPPWMLDVTGLLKPGANRVEVRVLNTLANHYRTIPTRYGGSPRSGLIGPVALKFS